MMTTANIEIAEAHHLAWVISRVCAVCPGSLGAPDGTYDAEKLPFLTWRDVDIQSENEPGRFTAKLTFRNLKTNFEDAERHDLITNPKVLHCVVTSPTDPANLIFSIPHRLLIIAIRRKIVIGINSIEELLHTDKKMIMVSLHKGTSMIRRFLTLIVSQRCSRQTNPSCRHRTRFECFAG
jgi:hypothetical protein